MLGACPGVPLMSEPLAIYLHDHMAGSKYAVELLESLRDHHSAAPLGAFAGVLLLEVEEDRQTLQKIIDKVGVSHSELKDAAAWLGEKVSRLRFWREKDEGLGAFEALETLGLGILGKASLWRALAVISQMDGRVKGTDFEALEGRARSQQARVEQYRLQMARNAFRVAA